MNSNPEIINNLIAGGAFSAASIIIRPLLARYSAHKLNNDPRNRTVVGKSGIPLTKFSPDADKTFFREVGCYMTLFPIAIALLGIGGVIIGGFTGNFDLVALSSIPAISHIVELGIRWSR